MHLGFSLDFRLELRPEDEIELVRLGAELGYESAWTPAGGDESAFERCIRWHAASGLKTGISVVPAAAQPPEVYAGWALRAHQETGGNFVFGVGSGLMEHPAKGMREYLPRLRQALGDDSPPVYVAALGPLMLRLAAEEADGVALNWCSPEQVAASRTVVEEAAKGAGRATPVIAEYIRVCVAEDPAAARAGLSRAMLMYAVGMPAYHRHYVRMGFGPDLEGVAPGPDAPERVLRATGGYGRPGQVREQFERLAQGLDVAIVRVVLPAPGDAQSARLALEEFAPRR